MKVALFANIGNRDLKYRDNFIKEPRANGASLLATLKKTNKVADFSLPILQPVFENVLRNYPAIDQVVLICTDQKDENYWKSDTIHFAEIIKIILKQGSFREQIKNVTLEKITTSPNDYDLMFNYYDVFLRRFETEHHYQVVFLCSAGGTPACNSSLILHGSRIFGSRAQVIYISEKEGVKPLNIAASITADYIRKTCQALLERYEFNAVAKILTENEFGSEFLRLLCEYCAARLIFDFYNAKAKLLQLKEVFARFSDDQRAEYNQLLKQETGLTVKQSIETSLETLEKFQKNLKPPKHGSPKEEWQDWLEVQKHLIVELVTSLKIKWLTHDYVDFLGRAFRFTEAVLRWLFEHETCYSANSDKHPKDFDLYLASEQGSQTKSRLEEKKGCKLIMNNYTLSIWLAVQAQQKPASNLPEISKIIDNICELSQLRNKSIIAHGYQSVTSDDIIKKYRKNNPLEDFVAILNYLGIPYQSDYIQRSLILIRKALEN